MASALVKVNDSFSTWTEGGLDSLLGTPLRYLNCDVCSCKLRKVYVPQVNLVSG